MNRLIFGCGYLGKPTAQGWVSAGDTVYAVTRKQDRIPEFEALGIIPIVADITQPDTLVPLPLADTVLFAVGMDRSTYSDIRKIYVDGFSNVLKRLKRPVGHLIYISSTGVYGDFDGRWVDEDSPTNPTRTGGQACLDAEQLVAKSEFPQKTILRLAGIYGPGRVPTRGQIESGQWKQMASDGYLNLIHVADAAHIINTISNADPLEPNPSRTHPSRSHPSRTHPSRTHPSRSRMTPASVSRYCVSDGNPPRRREYYQWLAQRLGVATKTHEPERIDSMVPANNPKGSETETKASRGRGSKRVSNRRLMDRFEIQLKYPDFRVGLEQALGG